jgi:hypothetical protein
MATLNERNRIAREIHDTLAQGLTGIVVQLQAAEAWLLREPERARQAVTQATDLARSSRRPAARSGISGPRPFREPICWPPSGRSWTGSKGGPRSPAPWRCGAGSRPSRRRPRWRPSGWCRKRSPTPSNTVGRAT